MLVLKNFCVFDKNLPQKNLPQKKKANG